MGRNKKHQKEVRSEKSKTQLKTKLKTKSTKTKFLPKGGNVTDVNFKIKPIVIREQLKILTGDEIVTKKKHNLKDILTRLNHYNTTMRFEACEGLTELLISSPTDTIEQSLYIILQGVAKLVLDIETKVRQKAIKVLRILLEKISNVKISPFFGMLSSYVLCAMTHIDKSIQEDSLLLIDIYLECVPGLIIKDFDKLFCNFLTLISKLRNDTKLSRTLTVNLNSKLTSIKWRIKVLSRLRGILNVVVANHNRKDDNTNLSSICKTVASNEGSYVPLYKNVRTFDESITDFYTGMEKSNETDYVKMLLPLLYETWAEAVPLDEIKFRENGVMLIDHDAASILNCIIGILHSLMELMTYCNNENVMRQLLLSKENKLLNHLLKQFPYRQNEHRKKIAKELNKLLVINTDPKCVQENLLIALVFCIVHKSSFPNTYHLERARDILKYINVCLTNRNYIPLQSITIMTMVLRTIFFENFTSWQQKHLISEKLLDNVVSFYKGLPTDNEHKIEVFNLLVDIAKESHIVGSRKFKTWLIELPLLLLEPEVSIKYVNSLSLLARQNNQIFIDALINILPRFLANLPKIKIINDELPSAHIKLINMLYYMPDFNLRHTELLQSFVETYNNWVFVENVKLLLLKKGYDFF